MKAQYKDKYGKWHLGENDTISEIEIKIDLARMNIEWDGDANVIRFKELSNG